MLTLHLYFFTMSLHYLIKELVCFSCSFADLQKPQVELDGKACAAVGQNGLMALYDTLFSQVNTNYIHCCSYEH